MRQLLGARQSGFVGEQKDCTMITRGHLIGQIVDNLARLQEQVSLRTKLGLTDLNVYTENFFRDLLNIVCDLDLESENDERSNAPGIDLRDATTRLGVQVTSTATSQKVNETLRKAAALKPRPSGVRILIVGKKQSTYTIDKPLARKFKFVESDIWDITNVGRMLVGLPIDALKKAYDCVSADFARVSVELEMPNEAGEFETSISDYVESTSLRLGNFAALKASLIGEEPMWANELPPFLDEVRGFATALERVPRITREVYALVAERNEEPLYQDIRVSLDELERICSYPDLHGELRILERRRFVSIWEDFDGDKWVKLKAPAPARVEMLPVLVQFLVDRDLSLRTLLASLDFTVFD